MSPAPPLLIPNTEIQGTLIKLFSLPVPSDLDTQVEHIEISLMGSIPAGSPDGFSQGGCLNVDTDTLHIPLNTRTFALKVQGNSMIGVGVLDGDTVILEFRDPQHGDIVAALIDGETTLKRFLLRGSQPYLRAENPRYPDLIPARELVIQGVMIALLRISRESKRIKR